MASQSNKGAPPPAQPPKAFGGGPSAGQQTVVVKAKDPDLQFIPVVVKHMALAIYKNKFGGGSSDGGRGDEKDRSAVAPPTGKNFKEAFAIARGLLSDYKHLTPSSRDPNAVGKINLTASGRLLESKHRREAGTGKKTAAFDLLYMKFIAPKPKAPIEKRGGG